ncbi:MAG: hypothetical protein EBW88_09210 [Betaproteobacteria bacterium]|nr:hypothetical protein [Betaproteobacteria bacterium]
MPSSQQPHYRSRIDLDEVKGFIEAQSPETKIYIGADSHRLVIGNIWFADYTLAIEVHALQGGLASAGIASGGSWLALFSSHPPIPERVAALESMR